MRAEVIESALGSVPVLSTLLDVEQSGENEMLEQRKTAARTSRPIRIAVSDYADCSVDNGEAVGADPERALRCAATSSIDVGPVVQCQPTAALDEILSANDSNARALHSGADCTREEATRREVDRFDTEEINNLIDVLPVLQSNVPTEIRAGDRTQVERDFHALVRNPAGVGRLLEESGRGCGRRQENDAFRA